MPAFFLLKPEEFVFITKITKTGLYNLSLLDNADVHAVPQAISSQLLSFAVVVVWVVRRTEATNVESGKADEESSKQ